MKRLFLGFLGLIVTLLAVMAIRATMLESKQPVAGEPASIEVDLDAVASRFSAALTYPTISHQREEDRQPDVFLQFHDFLQESFPAVHTSLTTETVNDLSLLYRWEGREPQLDPVLLMGHMDVVPVIPGTEEDWQHPPFGGIIADGQIWGRGALDDKSSVMAILEATENLVASGFQPRRTIYLGFGHDEEVGGPEGARLIAETLAERGVESFALILDEGGFIGEGLSSAIDGKVAVIGIAEKGFVSLELVVESDGGHSSTPPDHTALGILSKAVTRLEENQFPARLEGTTESMLGYIAPEMTFIARMVMANLWLTRPLVTRMMLADTSSAAMVRTTTAVTIMNGGVKENVLPIEARAVVNHRIIPGETVESVTQRAREVIDDERVSVSPLGWSGEPSPVSDPSSPAFELLGRTLLEVAPDEEITVTPYLVIGGTDAKYYSGRSDSVFRFLPVTSGADVMEMVHGTNERITLESLELAVRYFVQLIRNADDLAYTPSEQTSEITREATPEAIVLFDDFAYDDFEDMGAGGWLARTEKGIPGVLGASFGSEGVSFVADPDSSTNRFMRLASTTAGDATSTHQIQLCQQRKFLEGTYAARVHFEDTPVSGPDGDEIVETFYTISQMDEPNYSEADFEYLPNGGWGREEPTFWVTTWAPWGRVRPEPEDAEHGHDNTSSQRQGSFEGWHVLVLQVVDDSVHYFIDGVHFATHRDGYAPTAPLSINFNLWFVEGGLLDSEEPRQYVEHVDWVYHAAGVALTTEEIESRVAELRSESVSFLDSVPEWNPPLPSLCDL